MQPRHAGSLQLAQILISSPTISIQQRSHCAVGSGLVFWRRERHMLSASSFQKNDPLVAGHLLLYSRFAAGASLEPAPIMRRTAAAPAPAEWGGRGIEWRRAQRALAGPGRRASQSAVAALAAGNVFALAFAKRGVGALALPASSSLHHRVDVAVAEHLVLDGRSNPRCATEPQ